MSTAVMQKKENTAPAASSDQQYWLAPEVDIYETKERYTILAEMPGVNKSGLEVIVEDNELVLTGRREKAPIQGDLLHRETRATNFRRAFELDPAIDTDKITAQIEQGVLTLVLPKAEKTKPRRISVEG